MVTEPVRERETFKYYSTLTTGATSNHSGQPASSSELSSCDDAVLTALAQAGAFQTGTDRSLISLFDADYQYIVAEATPSSRLLPSVRQTREVVALRRVFTGTKIADATANSFALAYIATKIPDGGSHRTARSSKAISGIERAEQLVDNAKGSTRIRKRPPSIPCPPLILTSSSPQARPTASLYYGVKSLVGNQCACYTAVSSLYLCRDDMLFSHFSNLPMEIRFRIWSFALDAVEPRVVRANSRRPIKHSGSKNNPSLLFVNRESRKETLRSYELASDKDWTYINFDKDTLFADSFLSRDTLWSDPGYDTRIRHLALDSVLARLRKKTLFKKIERSPKLQKLVIVPNLYWYEIQSAVVIAFTDMDSENLYKFNTKEVRLVHLLKERARTGIEVCAAEITLPVKADVSAAN
ncbi:hypothetical protein V494_02926 [Pseudogymnoascus sp. VKM F-4513 (FW-928)]|nr:hypothetical protein V494_02926 [Pseudogymnoascus sp. VKM F-4513 (FW-928)]